MHPELFKIGPLTIHTYGFMMAMAFLTCYFILKWEIKRRGDDPQFASDIVFWAAIGGIVGAKLFYLFENFSQVMADPVGMIFSGAGLVFHGGLIGGTAAVVTLILVKKYSLGTYADIIGPVLLVGQGIGRLGCFFAGCCHGIRTSCFTGLRFPSGSQAANYHYHQGLLDSPLTKSLPVHPTQLYEAFFNFIVFIILIKWVRPRLKKRGSAFALYLIIAGSERFLLEFIRINPEALWGLTDYQFSSLALIIGGIILWKFFVRVPKSSQELKK